MIINLKELMVSNKKQELLETFCSEQASNINLIEALSDLEKYSKQYYEIASDLTISDLLKFKSEKLFPKRRKK